MKKVVFELVLLQHHWSSIICEIPTNSLFDFQYLSEVNEIENWINDKVSLASSTDYGKDENAADKLLAKNKVLETDIQTYQGIVNGVDRECKRLFKTGCQDPNSLKKAQVNNISTKHGWNEFWGLYRVEIVVNKAKTETLLFICIDC